MWRRHSWQIDQEHAWNSRRFTHLATWPRESDLWLVWRLQKRQTQCSIVSQSDSRCEKGSAWRKLNTSRVVSNPNTKWQTWQHLDSKIQTWKVFCCSTVCSELGMIKLDSTWTLNLIWDTFHSSSVNQDVMRTPNSQYTTSEIPRQTGVRRKTESDFEARGCNETQICVYVSVILGPKTNLILLKLRNIWPREWASVVNSTLSHWNVQRGIWCENPKQRWDVEDENVLTRPQSSWTAILLATQSRGKARRDWWLRLGTTLWNLDRRIRVWRHWALERQCSTQWWKEVKLDCLWDLHTRIWESQWRFRFEVTVRRAGQRTKHIDTIYFWVQNRIIVSVDREHREGRASRVKPGMVDEFDTSHDERILRARARSNATRNFATNNFESPVT